MPTTPVSRIGRGSVLVALAGLAVLRVLAADFRYFFEQDEMSLANGVASLMRGTVGYLYHYGPQIGYYRFTQVLSSATVGIGAVPIVMTTLAALAGAAIPVAALVAFKDELPDRLRVLAFAIVACSPVLWISSQYGNSGIVSTAFVVVGLAVLSNRPKQLGMAVALALCATGVLVRADAVLMAPAVAFLVFRASDDTQKALRWLVGGAVTFGLVFLAIRGLDPYMSGGTADVTEHFGDTDLRSLFWEHLMWGVSPIVLGFAMLGGFGLATEPSEQIKKPRELSWALVLWTVPVLAFYFGSTTTPRYFLLATIPFGIVAALGIERVASTAARKTAAWGVCLALAFAHLFVGLGHFAPADWMTVLKAPSYDTDDGPMPTGALLYQGYHRGLGVLGSSVRSGGWGAYSEIALGVDPELTGLVDGVDGSSPGTVYVLIDDWNGHVFHFHALKAGATLENREDGVEWLSPTHYMLGGTRITTVGLPRGEFDALERVEVAEGDEIWHVSPREPFPAEAMAQKVPRGLSVEGPIRGDGKSAVVYAVRRTTP